MLLFGRVSNLDGAALQLNLIPKHNPPRSVETFLDITNLFISCFFMKETLLTFIIPLLRIFEGLNICIIYKRPMDSIVYPQMLPGRSVRLLTISQAQPEWSYHGVPFGKPNQWWPRWIMCPGIQRCCKYLEFMGLWYRCEGILGILNVV